MNCITLFICYFLLLLLCFVQFCVTKSRLQLQESIPWNEWCVGRNVEQHLLNQRPWKTVLVHYQMTTTPCAETSPSLSATMATRCSGSWYLPAMMDWTYLGTPTPGSWTEHTQQPLPSSNSYSASVSLWERHVCQPHMPCCYPSSRMCMKSVSRVF